MSEKILSWLWNYFYEPSLLRRNMGSEKSVQYMSMSTIWKNIFPRTISSDIHCMHRLTLNGKWTSWTKQQWQGRDRQRERACVWPLTKIVIRKVASESVKLRVNFEWECQYLVAQSDLWVMGHLVYIRLDLTVSWTELDYQI